MDLKCDDIFNIDIDPALLLSYELDKLNLDNIPSDIFEFSEETNKVSDNLDGANSFLSENKVTSYTKSTLKLSAIEGELYASESKAHSESENQKKDVNGNEKTPLCENLNRLFDKLDLSDSDNSTDELSDCDNDKVEISDSENLKIELTDSDDEVTENDSILKERAPGKTQSRAKKNRIKNNYFYKNKNPDKNQFNPQTLKFLSGSCQIEYNEPNIIDQDHIHPSLSTLLSTDESAPSSIQDYLYEDTRAKAVCSPESGYESSSALSGSSSPPLLPLSTSYNFDFIPETVDEQNILEFLVENTTDCALTDHNLSSCNSDSKDAEGKIIEIINYLKDIPDELNESFDVATLANNIQEYVPLVNSTHELNITSSPVSCPVIRNNESPKKIVYKLNDKAKGTLRNLLSVDEFYAAKKRIYSRIAEAENQNDVKVICIEDETDKSSENRTNLHHAVLDSKIEDIYCLVEIHKQYNQPLTTDINVRDKHGKTALDYAIQNKMKLVIDYLKENNARPSLNI